MADTQQKNPTPTPEPELEGEGSRSADAAYRAGLEKHLEHAAKTALDIMKGASPASIPVTGNKQGKVYINPRLAAAAGIVFKPELVRNATVAK
jgi:ABC-type uncharacterized transport system substrate-binding protein